MLHPMTQRGCRLRCLLQNQVYAFVVIESRSAGSSVSLFLNRAPGHRVDVAVTGRTNLHGIDLLFTLPRSIRKLLQQLTNECLHAIIGDVMP
jgi:hypothetical protein